MTAYKQVVGSCGFQITITDDIRPTASSISLEGLSGSLLSAAQDCVALVAPTPEPPEIISVLHPSEQVPPSACDLIDRCVEALAHELILGGPSLRQEARTMQQGGSQYIQQQLQEIESTTSGQYRALGLNICFQLPKVLAQFKRLIDAAEPNEQPAAQAVHNTLSKLARRIGAGLNSNRREPRTPLLDTAWPDLDVT